MYAVITWSEQVSEDGSGRCKNGPLASQGCVRWKSMLLFLSLSLPFPSPSLSPLLSLSLSR